MKRIIYIAATVFLILPSLAAALSQDPVPVGAVITGTTAQGAAVQGNYAYVLVSGTYGGLRVYDISNPASMTLVGSNVFSGQGLQISVQGNYVYALPGGILKIFNVADPTNPTLVGAGSTSGGTQLAVLGNYAYVAQSSALQVFDVSNPTAPLLKGTVAYSGTVYSLYASGNYVYADGTAGLQIFDVSNPALPVRVSTTATAGSTLGAVTVQANYAYVMDGGSTSGFLQILDVSNRTSPVLLGKVSLGGSGGGFMSVVGNYAYAARDSDYFDIFDVTDKTAPVLVGAATTTAGDPDSIPVKQLGYAYVISGHYLEAFQVPFAVPTCSVTLSPNPSAYSYTGTPATLTWSSSNADQVYINNVGWVNPSGSTQVASQSSTDYSCYGYLGVYGNGTTTSASLTVTPPPAPTATISASSTSIYTGQSTGIFTTFSAGSGDIISHDNIDSPEGTGLGATTDPDASKYITFTPSAAGTYTFFARAQTGYYPSWTSYASTTITVNPDCTARTTYTCDDSQTIASTTVTLYCASSVTRTTCVSPSFCSPGSSTCLSPPPAFNSGVSDNGIALTGHLQVAPSLLRSGAQTHVYWNISNVSSCAVTGSNQDSWSGASSGTSGATSTPITLQTTYTLSCRGLDGSPINERATVNILPVFKEL